MIRTRSQSPHLPPLLDLSPDLSSRPSNHRKKSSNLENEKDQQDGCPFSGIDSCILQKFSQGENCPNLRNGTSIIFDEKGERMIFAYGLNTDDTYSSEYYEFSLKNKDWTKIHIEGTRARAECGCYLLNNRIWFFGGMTDSGYFGDLHYADLDLMKVFYPETGGDNPPPACQNPLVFCHKSKIIVWTSTMGLSSMPLCVLDTESMTWQGIETDNAYKEGANGVIVGDELFLLGMTGENSVLILNLNSFEFSLCQTTGCEPPTARGNLVVTSYKMFVICISTIGDNPLSQIYILNTKSLNWEVLKPDLNGISGTPNALFVIPRICSLFLVLQPEENDDVPNVSIVYTDIGKSIQKIDSGAYPI